jgi:two-component system, NtrC family, sensor histidine kinase AtoS
MTIAEAVVDKLPIAVYAIDDDRFVYVNAKFAETLGYTKEEILALQSAVDIIPGGQKNIVREILRRRAAGTLNEFRYITTARRRDGTLIDAEIHGSVADIDSGRIAIGAAVDIAPHLDLSRRLSEHEQYFRALTEGISDVIFIADPLGTITYVSQSVQEHLGGHWTDWLDRTLIDAVHPDDRERFSGAFHALLSSRSFGPEEFCMRSENGSWRDMEVAATNLLTHPQVQGLAFNVRDVTDRKKMARDAAQTQRLSSLGRVAAQVAHEFNNALMGIQSNAEVLRRRFPTNAALQPALEGIATSLARAKQITADILEFGRPPRLDLRSVRAADVVRQTIEEIGPQLPATIRVNVQRSETPPVTADPSRLSQVLVNLALNAKDAMAKTGGTLTVGTFVEGDYVHFHVTDSGEGIAAENLDRIFEPLFTTKKKGSGLGLSVVHQIVNAHGGHISVDSEVGKGTTFDVAIPVQR